MFMQTEINTREISDATKNTESESSPTKRRANIMVNGKMAEDMARDYSPIQTKILIVDGGPSDRNQEKEPIFMLILE